MSRSNFLLRNDPKKYRSRAAQGAARGTSGVPAFSKEVQRERLERAVVDDRGYIQFFSSPQRSKDSV